ncbi:MAG: cytochrome c biogenesis protein DipZ [Gammaproteobacteria bacterium]|nr:cytochrome c biogenesis protein DipZ [Gammaproteobacteria bacterium]
MTFLILSYLGGLITIASPCILPVLPFVFARAGEPFRTSGLPLLAGMGITFAGVATIATVGGNWAVQANQYGRLAALVVLAVLGLTLLWDGLAERLTRPLVRLGGRLSESAGTGSGASRSFVLGIATGLLWAPCAGPILGLVLTGAALQGANVQTSLLLLAYAAGAATSLAVALLAGGRAFQAMKRALGAEAWIRRALGVAVLAGVAAIGLGADRGILTEVSLASTTQLEQWLLDRFHSPGGGAAPESGVASGPASDTRPVAEREDGLNPLLNFTGATTWLNSAPLDAAALRDKVVLVDFWTYSCINCLRTLPYVRAWADKYQDRGFVVIGVHTPEFAFEKDLGNVKKALRDLGIAYPVALDNDYAVWRSFNNRYWPAHYFFDATGQLRHQHFGEGDYMESEAVIQTLLAERDGRLRPAPFVQPEATGAEAAAGKRAGRSPETYIGFSRARQFASAGGITKNQPRIYATTDPLERNDWGLAGEWQVGAQAATLLAPSGRIVYRFHARDLHLVLGPGDAGRPVRFRVTLDGQAPGADHGVDIDAQGAGAVSEHRLYQLVRQTRDEIGDRTFEIEFLDPGVRAYAFTFG